MDMTSVLVIIGHDAWYVRRYLLFGPPHQIKYTASLSLLFCPYLPRATLAVLWLYFG